MKQDYIHKLVRSTINDRYYDGCYKTTKDYLKGLKDEFQMYKPDIDRKYQNINDNLESANFNLPSDC